MKKLMTLILLILVLGSVRGQWNQSGSTISTSSNNIVLNSGNVSSSTLWLNNPDTGPGSRGQYYIKAYDWWGASLNFVGTGDQDNERLNVSFDGNVSIGTNQFESKLHVFGNINGWLQTIKGSVTNPHELVGIKLLTGYSGDRHKWVGIAATSLTTHGNNPGLAFYSGQEENMHLSYDGKLGIGTTTPSAKLDVAGNIKAHEIEVTLAAMHDLQLNGTLAANNITYTANGNTADFVFEDNYQLKDLSEVEVFIKANKHLPEIPSAAEMEEAGVNLAEMNKLLLMKVEELTLYSIEQEKRIEARDEKVESLELKVEELSDEKRAMRGEMEERLNKMEETLNKLINSNHE